jgi:hypothetical protein
MGEQNRISDGEYGKYAGFFFFWLGAALSARFFCHFSP